MLQINEFRVVMVEIEALRLFWAIEPTNEVIEDYAFTIMRSGGEHGPWSLVADDVTPFHYQDFDVSNYDQYRRYFYAIRVTNRSSGEYLDYGPVTNQFHPDNVALEMVRKKNVYLRARTGLPVMLFQKKRFGQYCPNCYDSIKQRSTKSKCHVCYGTNFAGGYWNPVDVFVNRNVPEREQYIISGGQQKQSIQMIAEMANLPDLSSGDMLLFPQVGTRFKVSQVTKNQRMGFTVSQYFQMAEINRSDIEYVFPVDRFI